MFGRCPTCGLPLKLRAALDSRRRVTGYRLHCPKCRDVGAFPESGPIREAWEQTRIEGLARLARYRSPFVGDRRAMPLIWPAPDEHTDPAAHSRSSAGAHVLQRFDGEDWNQWPSPATVRRQRLGSRPRRMTSIAPVRLTNDDPDAVHRRSEDVSRRPVASSRFPGSYRQAASASSVTVDLALPIGGHGSRACKLRLSPRRCRLSTRTSTPSLGRGVGDATRP